MPRQCPRCHPRSYLKQDPKNPRSPTVRSENHYNTWSAQDGGVGCSGHGTHLHARVQLQQAYGTRDPRGGGTKESRHARVQHPHPGFQESENSTSAQPLTDPSSPAPRPPGERRRPSLHQGLEPQAVGPQSRRGTSRGHSGARAARAPAGTPPRGLTTTPKSGAPRPALP